MSIANLRKQREEIKTGNAIADALPPDFDPAELNSIFGAAAAPSLGGN